MAEFDSGWTQVFKFNAIIYTVILTMSGVSLLALAVPGLSAGILCCTNCAILPLIAAMILTGIRRLNTDGDLCASSPAISDAETNETFADNGATLKALFIAQCVLYLPMLCCFNCGFQLTFIGDIANYEEKGIDDGYVMR